MKFRKEYRGEPARRAYVFYGTKSEYKVLIVAKSPMYYSFQVERGYDTIIEVEWIGVLQDLVKNLEIIASEWILD